MEGGIVSQSQEESRGQSLLSRGFRGRGVVPAWRCSRPLSPEWPAAAPVLAVSETCAWVSEVEAQR